MVLPPCTKLPARKFAQLVRGPSYYDLRRKPERALKRRNLVLTEMFAHGDITKKQLQF
jgi:penicillin-binding protein 1B